MDTEILIYIKKDKKGNNKHTHKNKTQTIYRRN